MAVYERAYRGYDGPQAQPWSRFAVISRYGLRDVFRSRFFLAKLQVGILGRQRLGLVGRQVLAEIEVDRMIEIEGLPPGERPPGNTRFHVVREG